jgi:hypothetical protein
MCSYSLCMFGAKLESRRTLSRVLLWARRAPLSWRRSSACTMFPLMYGSIESSGVIWKVCQGTQGGTLTLATRAPVEHLMAARIWAVSSVRKASNSRWMPGATVAQMVCAR